MAVLASVCDPHLNTIHAVAKKFSESRGLLNPGQADLNPPRPVDRLLKTVDQFCDYHFHTHPHTNTNTDLQPAEYEYEFFNNLVSYSEYVPPLGYAGPISIPLLEPSHPVTGVELDCDDIWTLILTVVDLSRTDAEALASRLTEKVRCYGFGPVITKFDVDEVCKGMHDSYLNEMRSTDL